MTDKSTGLVIVNNLPVRDDRRDWLQCTTCVPVVPASAYADAVVLFLDAEVTRSKMSKGVTLRARSGLDQYFLEKTYAKTFGAQAPASTGLAA